MVEKALESQVGLEFDLLLPLVEQCERADNQRRPLERIGGTIGYDGGNPENELDHDNQRLECNPHI